MTKCRLDIEGVANRAGSVAAQLPNAVVVNGTVAVHSALDACQSVNHHLVWLWGMLKHKRRYLKSIQQDGAALVCRCRTSDRTMEVKANGAEMLHLLNASLEVETE